MQKYNKNGKKMEREINKNNKLSHLLENGQTISSLISLFDKIAKSEIIDLF